MRPPIFGALVGLVAGLFIVGVAISVFPRSVQAQPRSARFELAGAEGRTGPSAGEALSIAVHLTGVPPGDDSVVALFEGGWFDRRLVSLAPASIPDTLSAVVTFEPHPIGASAALPEALRIEVSFARIRGMALERFLSRTLYVTLGVPQTHEPQATVRPPSPRAEGEEQPVHAQDPGLSPDQVLPAGPPVVDDHIHEEDLLARRSPAQAQTYWKELSRRVGQSWSRRVEQGRRSRAPHHVEVRFRLYPDGRAQLIQIERSSGSSDIDDAGMQAIVQALPFPPFPAELGSSPLELHVELRGGLRASVHSLRPAPPDIGAGPAGP